MFRALLSAGLTAALLGLALPGRAQSTAADGPDGPMKKKFTETCGICHDINRVRIGYTPDGTANSLVNRIGLVEVR